MGWSTLFKDDIACLTGEKLIVRCDVSPIYTKNVPSQESWIQPECGRIGHLDKLFVSQILSSAVPTFGGKDFRSVSSF